VRPDGLERVIDIAASKLVEVALPQIRSLRRIIFNTVMQEPKVVRGPRRLLLLDLPLGNTLPTQLLRHFLKKHNFVTHVVRISLSRAEGLKDCINGVRRKDLLKLKLSKTLRSADLIIYLDEWLSGSNFRAIMEHVERIAKQVGGVSFLPIGMLADEAGRCNRYSSHSKAHDNILKPFGVDSEDFERFRVVFPRLKGVRPRPGYFFWSESETICGYRKRQLFGPAFSVVDRRIETLMENPRLFAPTILSFLRHVAIRAQAGHADAYELFDQPATCFKHLRYCYDDYKKNVRQKVLAIEHPSNAGECANPRQSLKDIARKMLAIVKDRPAVVVVGLALSLPDSALCRDEKKYPIDEHAAVVVKLKPPLSCFHNRLLERIIAVMEA